MNFVSLIRIVVCVILLRDESIILRSKVVCVFCNLQQEPTTDMEQENKKEIYSYSWP
jgi:hypothetical protein